MKKSAVLIMGLLFCMFACSESVPKSLAKEAFEIVTITLKSASENFDIEDVSKEQQEALKKRAEVLMDDYEELSESDKKIFKDNLVARFDRLLKSDKELLKKLFKEMVKDGVDADMDDEDDRETFRS